MHDTPYTTIVRRLKRANGHLETIIKMAEQGRPCPEIAQQLQAVEKAIESAKKSLIHDHINRSLDQSATAPSSKARATVRELKRITKYL
jgi:DNA-binding FrmR family transcriptional regulator